MEWHAAIDALVPHIVGISTPQVSGTGWLLTRGGQTGLCAVATAAHVIDHAHYWEEPIRLHHRHSDSTTLLRPSDRSIQIESRLDTAAIVFEVGDMPLPEKPLPLLEKGKYLKPGNEIGWLGYPAIPGANLSFFAGRLSSYNNDEKAYLVDGVAINGVSGGPAFSAAYVDEPELVGVVSAYIPNRVTGESLPGLAVVRDVAQLHLITERFKSFDEAKSEESPASEPPNQRSADDVSARR